MYYSNMEKIRVVWITQFYNAEFSSVIPIKVSLIERVLLMITKRKSSVGVDRFPWNFNMLREAEKYTDSIDLYVICPYRRLAGKEYRVDVRGIHYIFVRDENSPSIKFYLQKVLNRWFKSAYKRNNRQISNIVNKLNPDVVHLIGAENVNYSPSILQVHDSIPVIVQMQTLMIDPSFPKNYPIDNKEYAYRSGWEKRVLQRANYIGCKSESFKNFIKTIVDKDKVFLQLELPEGVPICKDSHVKKEYDFEYHAININKAADLAIEAFAIAHESHPNITLDIIGGYADDYRKSLEGRLMELGIINCVHFEGLLPTHDDVLVQMQRAKFSLLPLKIDFISSTVREAIAYGNPLVSTITPGTPVYNTNRLSILLSPIGDHRALAENMCRLLDDEKFANQLRDNAFISLGELENHNAIIGEWVDAYRRVLKG